MRTQTGFTAIHFAVQADSRAALAVLLSNGANPLLSSLFDCMDTINCVRGTTALHLAARYGNDAVAHQLLKAYVSVSFGGTWCACDSTQRCSQRPTADHPAPSLCCSIPPHRRWSSGITATCPTRGC